MARLAPGLPPEKSALVEMTSEQGWHDFARAKASTLEPFYVCGSVIGLTDPNTEGTAWLYVATDEPLTLRPIKTEAITPAIHEQIIKLDRPDVCAILDQYRSEAPA